MTKSVEYQINEALADLTVGDVATGGGKLRPEQANTFYKKLIEASPLLAEIRTVQMSADSMNINKIALGQQITLPANAGTPPFPADDATNSRNLLAADRFNPAFSQITLSVKEYIAEFALIDDVVENNLEGVALVDIIQEMALKRMANDLEKLILRGDTALTGVTPEIRLLQSANGVLKQVTSNTVNAAGAFGVAVAGNVLKAVPEVYRGAENLRDYKFYLPYQSVVNHKVAVAGRQTSLGDGIYVQGGKLNVLGHETVDLGHMPNANGLFMNPKHFIMGMQRNMRIETERMPRARQTNVIFTYKAGFLHEEQEASVKITGLTG